MFTINDGYINALQEAVSPANKFDTSKDLTVDDLTVENIPVICNGKYIRDIKDVLVCDNCNGVFEIDGMGKCNKQVTYMNSEYIGYELEPTYYDKWEEFDCCPYCGHTDTSGDNGWYHILDTDNLIWDLDKLKYLEEITGSEFISELKKYIAEMNNTEVKVEAKEIEKSELEADGYNENYAELKDTVKKEMYKYLKANGMDVESLVKTGVELNNMKPIIDKLLDTYVATSVADYENEFNKGLAWDYKIENNDIIITIEDM